MRVVVPLAGPDFIGADGGLKADTPYRGGPLLRQVLHRRPWHCQVAPTDYSFVLIDAPQTRAFAAERLRVWFPQCQTLFLSTHTRGAALSALAAMALHGRADAPVIVDLADIDYTSDLDPVAALAATPSAGALALTFPSDRPCYSYLARDPQGRFHAAAEKQVISNTASAGTYIFANTPVYLRALAHALENEASQTWNGLFFVCPLFNGVRAQGLDVILSEVTDMHDVKTEE